MINVFGRKNIFRDLVFINAATGFLHGHFGQQHVLVQSGERHRLYRAVDLLLIHLQELLLGRLGAGNETVDFLLRGGFLVGSNVLLFGLAWFSRHLFPSSSSNSW
ncbi:hypothetical protein D3C76_1326180 [compost metagenome]